MNFVDWGWLTNVREATGSSDVPAFAVPA